MCHRERTQNRPCLSCSPQGALGARKPGQALFRRSRRTRRSRHTRLVLCSSALVQVRGQLSASVYVRWRIRGLTACNAVRGHGFRCSSRLESPVSGLSVGANPVFVLALVTSTAASGPRRPVGKCRDGTDPGPALELLPPIPERRPVPGRWYLLGEQPDALHLPVLGGQHDGAQLVHRLLYRAGLNRGGVGGGTTQGRG